MKPVIGIISYFPDDNQVRNNRRSLLKKLLLKCSEIFNLPVLIICQNWKSEDFIEFQRANINLLDYKNKLGIVGARNALRSEFLSSEYDYLIMLDDDCILMGNRNSGIKYINTLKEHPDGFGEFNKTLLKLFAISKTVFSKETFDNNINPENGDGFEDRIFVNKLRLSYPDKRFIIDIPDLSEWSISTEDPNSTWYQNNIDIDSMLEKTKLEIDNIKNLYNVNNN